MEQKPHYPPKSMMNSREGKNVPIFHPRFGGGVVLVFHLKCPRIVGLHHSPGSTCHPEAKVQWKGN